MWNIPFMSLLWINMAGNQQCLAIYGASLPYRISARLLIGLWDISKCPFMALCKLGSIMDQYA
jgi:hypothetical protein